MFGSGGREQGISLARYYGNEENQARFFFARARGYKTFFMLNSAEHKISTAHKN